MPKRKHTPVKKAIKKAKRGAIPIIHVYTDGSASYKASDGGWAAVIRFEGKAETIYGFAKNTTVSRMELMGVLRALQAIGSDSPHPVRVFTDSQYVFNTLNVFIRAWKAYGWVTSDGNGVKNAKLIQRLDEEIQAHRKNHSVQLIWIPGHRGYEFNEVADKLAGNARKKEKSRFPKTPLGW